MDVISSSIVIIIITSYILDLNADTYHAKE
jgi:hypothetical protein